MKRLLADCGSTKCDWAVTDYLGAAQREQFRTEGLNLALASENDICSFVNALPSVPGVGRVEFYGAGAGINQLNDRKLVSQLGAKYACTEVVVDTDLTGAARALFGNQRGVACILGTGSNSGLYDGERIILNTPPLGFILGDEGSGASLGKRLVNAVFKRLLPQEIIDAFFKEYPISKEELINRVYRQPGANFFLAQFTRFLSANINRSEIAELVEEEFRSFFTHNLLPYVGAMEGENPLPHLGFVGSIAFHFSAQLLKVAAEELPGVDTSAIRILQSPISMLQAN